jgi:hypothetical protein
MLDYTAAPQTYKISASDAVKLENIAQKEDEIYGYARAIYYVLTGKTIEIKSAEMLSLQSRSTNNMIPYPNPVSDFLNVSHELEIRSIKIMDLYGRLVQNIDNVKSKNHQIDVQGLYKGIYIIEIIDGVSAKNLTYKISKL